MNYQNTGVNGTIAKAYLKKNQTMKGVMYKESVVQIIVDFSILTPETQKQ